MISSMVAIFSFTPPPPLFVFRCFIPNIYAALCAAVLVPLICLVAVLVVFIHAYKVSQQWKAYDDIYRGRTNSTGWR